ncbi:GbsR/MarR family transcriptional regulator [Nocardioides agariphilus]
MPDRSQATVAATFVERMGGALTDAGLPRLPSRVFAALVVDEDGKMTAAELATTLAVSPAAVSGAVNFLGQIGFLHRERERGSRKDVYVVDDDAWLGAMMRKDQTYAPLMAALDNALEGLGEKDPAAHRLWLMREFLAFVDAEMDGLAERWQLRRRELEEDVPHDTPGSFDVAH